MIKYKKNIIWSSIAISFLSLFFLLNNKNSIVTNADELLNNKIYKKHEYDILNPSEISNLRKFYISKAYHSLKLLNDDEKKNIEKEIEDKYLNEEMKDVFNKYYEINQQRIEEEKRLQEEKQQEQENLQEELLVEESNSNQITNDQKEYEDYSSMNITNNSTVVLSNGNTPGEIGTYAAMRMEEATGVSRTVWENIIARESNGQPDAVNPSGASGLFQTMPFWGPTDTVENQIQTALKAYNEALRVYGNGLQPWQ